MRGLKQRSMPAVDEFVATCSVCGAALRPVHVLRGTAGPRCSSGQSALMASGREVGGQFRPHLEDDSPLSVCSRSSNAPTISDERALVAVSKSIVLLAVATGCLPAGA